MHYLLLAIITTVTTALSSYAVLVLARRFELLHQVRDRDVHTKAVPRLGGFAMFLGFITSLLALFNIREFHTFTQDTNLLLPMYLGCAAIVLIGVFDDLFNLDWMVKLGAQLAIAAYLSWSGIQILSLPFGDTRVIASPAINFTLTVFLICLVMNAVNFIDGLDGLVAGFAIICSSVFFIYTRILASSTGESSALTLASILSVIVFGTSLGFLPFNWHRAKMFMGDSGALLTGLLMACSTLSVTGQINPGTLAQTSVVAGYIPIILPLALLFLPLLDFIFAVFRRVYAGKSPFAADRKHLHHRLLDYGHSQRQAVVIFYLWTAVVSTSCLLVFLLQDFGIALLLLVSGGVVCAVVTLVPFSRIRKQRKTGGFSQHSDA